MGQFIDLAGHKYGRLTVISRAENKPQKSGRARVSWNCVCDCGVEMIVTAHDLRNGNTKSCGCYRHDLTIEMNKITKKTHGKWKTRLYKIWRGMKDRCYNKSLSYYKNYGGRGVSICEEWKDNFKAFYDWSISHGYQDGLTIDRIDVNGNYEPSNCRWITMKEQGRNRRTNRIIEYNGETKVISEWAEIFGISRSALLHRINAGWEVERALKQPIDTKKARRTGVVI